VGRKQKTVFCSHRSVIGDHFETNIFCAMAICSNNGTSL